MLQNGTVHKPFILNMVRYLYCHALQSVLKEFHLTGYAIAFSTATFSIIFEYNIARLNGIRGGFSPNGGIEINAIIAFVFIFNISTSVCKF